MSTSAQYLNASEAAKQLGISTKALRVYEERGFLCPSRTSAGYRVYGSDEMSRAAGIVALRALGLSLAKITRVLEGDSQSLESVLVAHEAALEDEIRQLVCKLDKARGLRTDIADGQLSRGGELTRLLKPNAELTAAFQLPFPWGGESFEIREIRPLTYIVGPLGSGKTHLAHRVAEVLPAMFLGLDRLENGNAVAARLDADSALQSRVNQAQAWLIDEGATESLALTALLVGLETEGPTVIVVDMIEQGLDHDTQEALISYLRHRAVAGARPLFLMTRSSAILNLTAVGADEAIILCPANHSPPTRVAPYPGAPGYEAVATCLAPPEVRARIAGPIGWCPESFINCT